MLLSAPDALNGVEVVLPCLNQLCGLQQIRMGEVSNGDAHFQTIAAVASHARGKVNDALVVLRLDGVDQAIRRSTLGAGADQDGVLKVAFLPVPPGGKHVDIVGRWVLEADAFPYLGGKLEICIV